MMSSSVKNIERIKCLPDSYIYKHPTGESVNVFVGVKRGGGANKSWVVNYKRRVYIFFDRDFSNNWRFSLQKAEEHLRSIYISPGSVYPKPNFKLVKVKRPHGIDLIDRVKLNRFGGGYKFFDLDPTLPASEAILKAYYEATEWHWNYGVKLGLVKSSKLISRDYSQIKLLGVI